jgi:hypothetical protein
MIAFRSLTILGLIGAAVGIFFGAKGLVTAKHATDSVNRKGGDEQSLFHAGNLDKAMDKVRAKVGDDGKLLELTVYPGYMVVEASSGSEDKGRTFRIQEDGNVKELPLTLTGPGLLKDNVFPISSIKSSTVEKLANQAAAKEHLDLNGVTHIIAQIDPVSGKPGLAVYLNDSRYWRASLNGEGLSSPDKDAKKAIANAQKAASSASKQVSAAASSANNLQQCLSAAGTDAAKIQACTK